MIEKELNKQILEELQSINRKLEVIGSNFELKDTTVEVVRDKNGKRIIKTKTRGLDYLG